MAEDHAATAGFGGSGATAFPAQAAGKDLHGEHLSDFRTQDDQGPKSGGVAERPSGFPEQSGSTKTAGEPFDSKSAGGEFAATTGTAGFAGGGATAFPAQAAHKDLKGEHLSDFKNLGSDTTK